MTVTNSGNGPATLGTMTTTGLGLAAPFSLDGGTCTTGYLVVADGGACTLVVAFSPVSVGPSSDTVALVYSNGLIPDAGASRDVAGTGWDQSWSGAALVERNDAGSASKPQVTVDPSGNVIAVWEQAGGAQIDIWANRYAVNAGLWGDAGLIESDNAGNATFPQVAIDSAGNAVTVWNQSDGILDNIWANILR